MGHYEMQVLVRTTINGDDEWRSVRPSHGEPYRYETREEAESMLRMCYPDECVEIRLGAEPKVRVKYVLEDK